VVAEQQTGGGGTADRDGVLGLSRKSTTSTSSTRVSATSTKASASLLVRIMGLTSLRRVPEVAS